MRFEPIKMQKHQRKHYMTYIIILCIIIVFITSIHISVTGNKQRQKEYLMAAINNDITYHYTTTGIYPDNLQTIENKYGLTYDKDKFYIDYKIFGKNIYPKVVILEK